MSKIALEGNASGTGTLTIAAPNTSTNRTITLPDATGELALQFGNGVGKILQVVRATDSTTRTTTSTSFVDANISVTITPKKNDSAVLLLWVTQVRYASTDFIIMRIADSSNNAISGAESMSSGDIAASNTAANPSILAGFATPGTTSAVTFKGRFASNGGGLASILNATCTGQLYALEVAA